MPNPSICRKVLDKIVSELTSDTIDDAVFSNSPSEPYSLISMLSSLSQIALYAPEIYEHHANEINSFIVNEILRKNRVVVNIYDHFKLDVKLFFKTANLGSS